MSLLLRLFVIGVLIVFTIATGIWVSSLGRPINTGALAVHKLTALATVVFLFIAVRGLFCGVHINPIITVLFIIVGLSIIALFASGALLNISNKVSPMILTLHAFTPVIMIISLVMAVYLLIKGR